MIPFKGRHGLTNYMPNKPVKWGHKLWCSAGISGCVYDFENCGGDAKSLPDGIDVGRRIGEYSPVVVRRTLLQELNEAHSFISQPVLLS